MEHVLTNRWSSSVERRVKALKKLEYEAIKQLRVNYYVELHALDTKYQELFFPLDQQVQLLAARNLYRRWSAICRV